MTFGKTDYQIQYPKTIIIAVTVIIAAFSGLDQSDLSCSKNLFYAKKTCENNRRMIEH